VNEPQRRQGI